MYASVIHATGAPSVLSYEEVPDPTPEPGQVVLAVEAVGIQGGDLLNRARGQFASFPHVVGYQAAGTIHALGHGVDSFSLGERVVALMPWGSHAELAAVDASSVYRMPEELELTTAAASLVEFGTAAEAVNVRVAVRPGESILITAPSGGVGSAAIQLARRAGAYPVICTTSQTRSIPTLLELGADVVVEHTTEDLASRVLEATAGQGVDVLLDSVGGPILASAIQSLAPGARVAWVGRAARAAQEPDLFPLMMKNAVIEGVHFGNAQLREPARIQNLVSGVLSRVASGELRPLMDRTFALSEAADAHRHIEGGHALGRVLLIP